MQCFASIGAFAGDDFGLVMRADNLQVGFFFKTGILHPLGIGFGIEDLNVVHKALAFIKQKNLQIIR